MTAHVMLRRLIHEMGSRVFYATLVEGQFRIVLAVGRPLCTDFGLSDPAEGQAFPDLPPPAVEDVQLRSIDGSRER